MSNLSDKTTIYLNPNVKRFLQHKAIVERRSVSDIINEEFADMLEDLEDIKEIEERRNESTVPFETVLLELGLSYDDLRS